ncbi:MAG: dephospho-CoA kinase [Planctomycetes bacterium]|nr:dephospho-CoA kinase [Planctomycetota bacterium]
MDTVPPAHPENPTSHPVFGRQPPIVIGLMGGIASGKTAVAGLFTAHGLRHIDADRIAREVTMRPAVLAAIGRRFGTAVIAADGSLDRVALAARVFSDPTARHDLEALTHPPIRAAILAALQQARQAGASVLLDAPLLLEGGLIDQCDEVVFVDAAEAVRRARARARGWADDELARREAAQASLAVKMARATTTIHNDGDLADTARQVAAALARWATAPDPDR